MTLTFAVFLLSLVWLAYNNGANDNFKGVATLYGSGTLTYRAALWLSTASTFAGALVSVVLAGALVKAFGGRGIVSSDVCRQASFLISIALASGATVFLATALGMPTSTTHAITGSLAGAALAAQAGPSVLFAMASTFFLPLMLSPLLAIFGSAVLYFVFHRVRKSFGITKETCVCVRRGAPATTGVTVNNAAFNATVHDHAPRLIMDSETQCLEQYGGSLWGVSAQSIVDRMHIVSGLAVCFARALNDTPKIAALLIAAQAGANISAGWMAGVVAIAMAMGGLLGARRVAETMSHRITELNSGQGLTGSFVTALLVLIASPLGMPVSTTHVSCGTLFGIGLISGTARTRTIYHIVLTWITTLPVAALLSAVVYGLMQML